MAKPKSTGQISQRAGAANPQNTSFVSSKTESTPYPDSTIEPGRMVLSGAKRAELELALQQIVDAALADRENLDQLLQWWNSLYEQDVAPRDTPWPNAANMFVPIVPTYMDSIVSQLQAMVFTPRFFVVTGLTPEAAKVAYTVEQYYNHELWQHNWIDAFNTVVSLAARDGVGIMEIIWDRTIKKEKKLARVPQVVNTPFGPVPAQDANGEVKFDLQNIEYERVVYDNVRLIPVELRDFFLSPAWATSIESAVGVGRKVYITEHEIRKLVASGVLWEDAANRVISFTNTQTTDLSLDRQPIGSYLEAGAIAVGAERGGAVSGEIKILRGPIMLWRYHTREFQINKDGEPEELVLWYHDPSRTLVGVNRYPYLHGKRPFEACALMPRPNRFRGFGIPERLAFIQTEANALENQALDRNDQALQAPMYQKEDVKLIKGDKEWGPGAKFQVPEGPTDVGWITVNPLPIDVYELKQDIELQAQKLLGFTAPTTTVQQASKERQSKYEVQVAAQSIQVRMQSFAQQLRQFAKNVLLQINELKKQYGPDESSFSTTQLGRANVFTVTKDMLAEPLEFDVSGDVTSVDKAGRTQEAVVLYQTLMRDPLVASNPQHHYAALRNLLEAMGYGAMVVDLIGTEQEAIQQMQQMQQQQQAENAVRQADAQSKGGGKPPGGGGGAPAGAPVI